PASRAPTPTGLPAVGRDRQLEQQRLAHPLAHIQPSTVVKQHVVVALELHLVAPLAGAGAIREDLERDVQGALEPLEAPDAFQPRHAPDPSPDRDALPAPLDDELAQHLPGPCLRGAPNPGP